MCLNSRAGDGVGGVVADRSLTHAWRRVAGLAIAGFAALPFLLPASASAHPKPRTQVADPVRPAAPDANLVKESFVRVHKPLPKRDGPHPKACDWVPYLPYRRPPGPRRPSQADCA